MASFTWLVVGRVSPWVPNTIRPQVSLLVGQLRLIHKKSQRIQEQLEGVSFQVSACVTFTEALMVSHMDKPRAVVGQDHLREWVQEV